MRISDSSSDVCSSDLHYLAVAALAIAPFFSARRVGGVKFGLADLAVLVGIHRREAFVMAFRTLGGPFLLHRLTVSVAFRLGDRAILVGVDLGELLVELLLKLGAGHRQIGRASCRERVCQYV